MLLRIEIVLLNTNVTPQSMQCFHFPAKSQSCNRELANADYPSKAVDAPAIMQPSIVPLWQVEDVWILQLGSVQVHRVLYTHLAPRSARAPDGMLYKYCVPYKIQPDANYLLKYLGTLVSIPKCNASF